MSRFAGPVFNMNRDIMKGIAMSERVVRWSKRWCQPRFTIYTPADKGPRVLLNKYGDVNRIGGVTIGICAVLFHRAWSLTWAKPVSHQEIVCQPNQGESRHA